MIFFQQSAVVDKGLARADLPQGRFDTAIGAAVAAVAAIATLVAAAPLFIASCQRLVSFASGADFATALQPLLGGHRRRRCSRSASSRPGWWPR